MSEGRLEPENNNEGIIVIITCIISGFSIFVYSGYLIIFIKDESKVKIKQLSCLQMMISCFINTISFFFIANTTKHLVCQINSFFNIISNYSNIGIASMIVIILYQKYINPSYLVVKRFKLLVVIGILCWLLPMIIGIISIIFGKVKNKYGICKVSDPITDNILNSISLLLYIWFFACVFTLTCKIRIYFKEFDAHEFCFSFEKKMVRFSLIVTIQFLIFIFSILLSLKILFPKNSVSIISFIITAIQSTLPPIFTIVFCYERASFKNLIAFLKCKNTSWEIRQEGALSLIEEL